MLERFVLVLIGLSVTSISHAAGLKDFVEVAGSEASGFMYGVLAIVAVGIVGIVGSAILGAFGNQRVGKIVTHGSYLAAVGIFVSMAMNLFNQFVRLVFG